MTGEWRQGVVGGSGLLVLVSGFLPWWVVRVEGDVLGPYTGSAWRMSSRWTWSLLLTVAAAVVWVTWHLVRGRVAAVVWLGCLVAVGMSAFWTVDQLRDIETVPPLLTQGLIGDDPTVATAVLTAEISEDAWEESVLPRNAMQRYSFGGTEAGTGWGLWAGLTGIGLTGLSLAAAGRGGVRAVE